MLLTAHLLTNLLASLAIQEPDAGAVAFRQACLDATTDRLVVNLAAHPDDEASRSLAILRRQHGWRAATLFTTSGDGGQNAIGREVGAALAAVRIRETLAAATHLGTEVHWLGLHDFGYSKTVEETLEIWGGQQHVQQRFAAALAALDPDLLLTNHGVDRGHGHHRATAVAVAGVLEHWPLEGPVPPLLERMFVTFEPTTAPPPAMKPIPDLILDGRLLDPTRGVTFARQAHRGLLEHRSQGPWGAHDPAAVDADVWRRVGPSGTTRGIDLNAFGSVLHEPAFQRAWVDAGGDLQALGAALAAFGRTRPAPEHIAAARALCEPLRRAARQLAADPAGQRALRRLQRRIVALEQIVLAGAGVSVEAWLAREQLPAGGRAKAVVVVHTADAANVRGIAVSCRGVKGTPIDPRAPDLRRQEIVFTVDAAQTPPPLANGTATPLPDVIDVHVALTIDGLDLQLQRPLLGQRTPPVDLQFDREAVFAPHGVPFRRIVSLQVQISDDLTRTLELQLDSPEGCTAVSLPTDLTLTAEQRSARVLVMLEAKDGLTAPGTLRARLGDAAAELPLLPGRVLVPPGVHVALVRGPDDSLRNALADLQVPFEDLDPEALATTDLSRFTTMVLDIRAYHHRPDLALHQGRLFAFAAAGGRVLAFYHKPGEWNPRAGHPLLTPRNLEIGGQRVCDEQAAVTFLTADHRLLTHPHALTAEDFAGWQQERGLNFAAKWDQQFVPLLAMADAGEDPAHGALLWLRHEQGDFVYCALSLYRQLRQGHAGAARLLVNLLTP